MTDNGHIFISYARQDGREIASRLDNDLQKTGFHTWRDTRDIDPAQDFSAEIENGIEKSACVALCITPDSKRSDSFVRREIQYAQIIKKPVIPLRFADIPPHVPVVNNEWIDFFKGWEPAFERLCSILKHPLAEPRPTTLASAIDDPFRDYLNGLYQNIVRYLNLTVFSLITLRGDATPDAVAEAGNAQVLPMAFWEMASIPDQKPKHFRDFPEAFEQYEGRVLLLGEPGAGKTTTLFAFARDRVASRLEDSTQPLPILAPLATWDARKQTPLTEWLAASIPMLKQTDLEQLIKSRKALLLLDGLDELGGERADDAAESAEANRYDPRLRFMDIVPPQTPVIVTCRIKDYSEIGEKLALKGALTLQPLNDEQMKAYLRDMPDLWAALESDVDLREVARTPLLLSLFTFAFRDLPDEAKALRDLTRGDLRDKIFETYVRRRYEREAKKPNAKMPFSLEKINMVLGKVAVRELRNWSQLLGESYAPGMDVFGMALDYDTELADRFVQLAIELSLIAPVETFQVRFVHSLLRDYFAYHYALLCLDDETSSTLEKLDVLKALRDLRDLRALDVLIRAMHNPEALIRRHTIRALGSLRDVRTIPALLAAVKDSDASVRRHSVYVLGILKDDRAFEPLVKALSDEDSEVRSRAIYALGDLGDARAFHAMLPALSNPNADTRYLAARALGKMGDLQAVEPLMQALSDTEPEVRRRVAHALGRLGDSRAVPMLIHALSDKDDYVQLNAVEALEALATPQALAAVAAWRNQHGDL